MQKLLKNSSWIFNTYTRISKMLWYNSDIVVVGLGGTTFPVKPIRPQSLIVWHGFSPQKIRALSSRQPKLFFSDIVSIARGKFRKPLDDRNLTPNRGQSIIFYKLGRTYIRIDVKFPRHYFNEARTILSLMSISKKVNSRCSE